MGERGGEELTRGWHSSAPFTRLSVAISSALEQIRSRPVERRHHTNRYIIAPPRRVSHQAN
jgi:hypothetical protein